MNCSMAQVVSGKWCSQALMWICVLVGMPAMAQTARRFPVSSEQVLAAMRARGWEVQGVQVTMAAPMTAAVADPALAIQTITMLGTHEARLRMVCRAQAACLPFFATAVWPESTESTSLPQALMGHGAREKETLRAAEPVFAGVEPGQPKLRVGTAATLLIDVERIHIRVQVVCLEGGVPGDKIRVTTRDHKQAYMAEIVTPTMLKGSL